jgi:DNA-binding PadR family transcriptional regulator
MARGARTEPSLTQWAILGLLSEGRTHGWSLVRALAPDGEIGQVWTTSRPLVYRALGLLRERGYVAEHGSEASSVGPSRTLLSVTPAGRRTLNRWLARPVEHLRDVRSELMLKLLLLERRGADPAPLLQAQRELIVPVERALAGRARRATGFARTLALWRLANARAALRFIDSLTKIRE